MEFLVNLSSKISIFYRNILQKYFTEIFYRNILQKYFTEIFYRNILQKYFTEIFYRNILQKYFTEIFYRNILQKYFTEISFISGDKRAARDEACSLSSVLLRLLSQCGKKNTPEVPPGVEVTITADETTVTFLAEGGDYEVKITSSGDWNVKEEIAWLEATKVDNTLLKVTCEENTGDERSGKVTATIEDQSAEITVTQKAPDTQPSFGSETIDDQTYGVMQLIPAQFLPEATGGNGALTYSLTRQDGSALPTWLTFTEDTRLFEGTTPATAVIADLIYTATDSDGDKVTLEFKITIDPRLMFDSDIDNQTYLENSPITDLTLPKATGGSGAMIYSLTPTLPASLRFDPATRVLSGTPDEGTAASATAYSYTVTDAGGNTLTLTFTITIQDDLMPEFDPIDMIMDQTYVENSPIKDLTLPAATGGDGTLTYSLTPALPANLRFDPATRLLSGTPPPEGSASAATTYTYTATDEDGDPATLTFTITIQDDLRPLFSGISVPAQVYTAGKTITPVELPWTTGGNGMLTYSLARKNGSDLPEGLTFTSATRLLEGRPMTAAAEETYVYTVTDTDNDASTLEFTITVRAAVITLNYEALELGAGTASNTDITLTSNVAWEVTKSGDWISSVTPTMGTGTNTAKTITLTYTENTGAERTGTVTFTETTPGVAQKFVCVLTVTQGAPIPDGTIPITHLEHLNAMRYDLNTDGKVDHKADLEDRNAAKVAYAKAFPNLISENTYKGYELANDLDFNEDDSYLDATTNKPKWAMGDGSGMGWAPVGKNVSFNITFRGLFDGGGHTISNLYINRLDNWAQLGLFGPSYGGTIQKVGLVSPNVTGGDHANIGSLVGQPQGNTTIRNCYVLDATITGGTGTGGRFTNTTVGGLIGDAVACTISACYVKGGTLTGGDHSDVGGLAGSFASYMISTCYVSGVTVSGGKNADVGGLVGHQLAKTVIACYVYNITATAGKNVGSLIGNHTIYFFYNLLLQASYAGGTDYTIPIRGTGNGRITNNYSQAATVSDADNADATTPAKTRAALITPAETGGYTGIYADWDVDLDNADNDYNYTTGGDDPWDFGTDSQYPVLDIDFNGDGNTSDDITAQRTP